MLSYGIGLKRRCYYLMPSKLSKTIVDTGIAIMYHQPM